MKRQPSVTEATDQFEITAHPQNASVARERVLKVAKASEFPPDALGDIEVAVGEAVTNAILYGSPTATSRIVISCGFSHSGRVFHVEVRDQGRGFDPSHIRNDDNMDALGGRGIRLMRALMDSVLMEYHGDGMAVCLSKKVDRK